MQGCIKVFVVSAHYVKLHQNTEEQMSQKKATVHEDDQKPFGHEITLHKQWPIIQKVSQFRLLDVNVYWFQVSHNNLECEFFIQQMAQYPANMQMVAVGNQLLGNSHY